MRHVVTAFVAFAGTSFIYVMGHVNGARGEYERGWNDSHHSECDDDAVSRRTWRVAVPIAPDPADKADDTFTAGATDRDALTRALYWARAKGPNYLRPDETRALYAEYERLREENTALRVRVRMLEDR